MARLTRKNIKVFAGNASNNGVFGSLQANNPTLTNDVERIQSLQAWEDGWDSATSTAEKLPPLEEFQGVQYVTTYQQAYIMQEGIPEWSASVTYYKGSITKEITATGFILYSSNLDNNKGYLLNNTAYWTKVFDSSDPYAFASETVNIFGDQEIDGKKDFNDPITAPTPSISSNDKTVANTEWVRDAIPTAVKPTYSSLRSISSGYTASKTGVVYLTLVNGGVTANISVNGVQILTMAGHSGSSHGQPRPCATVILGAGDTITFNNISSAYYVPIV